MDNDNKNRILPFSLENLRAVLPTPTMAAADCPICQAIGSGGDKLIKGRTLEYDTIPAAVQQLKPFMSLGEHINTNWLEICPQCERLYHCEKSYEFLIGFGGSEDCESYHPITPEQVLDLWQVAGAQATGKAEIHEQKNGIWSIVREPQGPEPEVADNAAEVGDAALTVDEVEAWVPRDDDEAERAAAARKEEWENELTRWDHMGY